MSKSKLSVVIPAYNEESTLQQCVESVLVQAVESLEIIIVDDGSTDSTLSVALSLESKYKNIKVLHQQNRGLSVARNEGIEASSGELITFVDSDDFLREETYPALIAFMEEHSEIDILEYSLVRTRGEHTKRRSKHTTFENVVYPTIRDYWLEGRGFEHAYAWNKLFRRTVFFPPDGPELRFEEDRTFEDSALFVDLLSRQLTIATTDKGSYVYQQNPQGITSTASAKAIGQLLDTHLRAIELLKLGENKDEQGMRKLTPAEEDYYMSAVNIQITLCQLTNCAPVLPSYKVSIRKKDFSHFPRLTKKLILNISGINTLCRIYRLIK